MNESKDGVIDKNKDLMAQVISFVQRYQSLYLDGEISICLVYNENKYLPALCKIELRPLDSARREDRDLDYGDVRLIRSHFTTAMFGTHLDSICKQKNIEIPSVGNISFPLISKCPTDLEMSSRSVHKYSHQIWFPVKSDWPFYFLSMQLEDLNVDYQKPLLKNNLPAYARYDFAITDFFNFVDGWQAAQNKSVYILIPDLRARIEQLQLTGNLVNISLKTGSLSLKNLLVKLFAKKGETFDSDRQFIPDTDHITIRLEFEPEFLSVYLMDSKTGEEVDWKQIDLIWGSKTEATDVVATDESLIQWIQKGEGENVEFKSELEENSTKVKFKKSVTAFSNTKGGLIFIGIDDEGVPIKDCYIKDETIVNLVQEIEPDPKISFHRITFNDKRILVVEVEEGTDKPYNLRDQGIFIRRGKTNSRASRLEIEKFFEQKPNN